MARKSQNKRASEQNNNRRNSRSKSNVIHMNDYASNLPQRARKSKVEIIPKNLHQEDYLYAIDDFSVVFGVGPAGTGKTLLATLKAIEALKSGEIERIIVTRPAVSVDEQHGFLPGTLIEKMAPWTRPIFDVFEEYYTPRELEKMIEEGIIEVAPLAYMRGRTFKNSYILFDEAQNSTEDQMKMVLTRIGENSKMIITGDLNQHDRGYANNGLKDFLARVERAESDEIEVIRFEVGDVERSPVVEAVLNIYGKSN